MRLWKPHADQLVPVEGERPRVAVFAEELGAHQSHECIGQRFRREGQGHVEQPRRLEEAAEVVVRAEDEELGLVRVPVAADPAEDPGAVVQSVREDADPGLGVRDDAAAEERVAGKSHFGPPSGFARGQSTFRVHIAAVLQLALTMDSPVRRINSHLRPNWTDAP